MRVVLREPAHAQQPVHGPAALVAVHGSEFAQPHRQFAIAAELIAVNQDVARAVHRLQAILGVIEFHAHEHILGVMAQVAGRLPQIRAHHVRRIDQVVTAREILVAHPVLDQLTDDSALGVEENQPRPGQLLNAEQI